MSKFLRLKETSQYLNAISSNNQVADTASSKLRLDLTNSIYDEITRIVTERGYSDIYNTLDLSNAPSPISFNFKLKELYIENYRSIDKYTLNFDEINGKVVNLSGLNGSGKSSLMHALRDVLIGSRYINKNNRKVNEDKSLNCLIRLSLMYNDKLYFITRGTGVTTFAVDDPDNLVTKANKKELEEYIIQELPLIKYISYFILEANQHFFDTIDRTALIKTCFNLEIFDYIYNKSNSMYNEIHGKLDDIKQNILREQDYQTRLQSDLESYTTTLSNFEELPKNTDGSEITIKQIQSKVDEATKYYTEANNAYNELVRINSSIQNYNAQLGRASSLNKTDITSKIELLNKLDSLESEYTSCKSMLDSNTSILALKARQLDSIKDSTTYCPHCNKILIKDEHYEVTKNNLMKEVQDLTNMVNENTSKMNSSFEELNNFINTYGDIRSSYKSKVEYLSELEAIENLSKIQDLINLSNVKLLEVNSKYEDMKNRLQVVTEGKKYNDFLNEMTSLISKINQFNNIKDSVDQTKKKIVQSCDKVIEYEGNITSINFKLNRVVSFRNLFEQKNLDSIPYSIIDMILKSMNTPSLKFSSTKELASGEERFEVNCSCNISSNPSNPKWINYDNMSHGQKVLADLFILQHIINLLGNTGLLIMDESLANLDEEKYANAKQFFDDTMCDKIIVASHNPNFDGADYRIQCTLNTDGITEITELY